MRTNLTLYDLGDLLAQPLVAVLATLRDDGSVLLSPVATYVGSAAGDPVIARIAPGDLRAWDFADEYGAMRS